MAAKQTTEEIMNEFSQEQKARDEQMLASMKEAVSKRLITIDNLSPELKQFIKMTKSQTPSTPSGDAPKKTDVKPIPSDSGDDVEIDQLMQDIVDDLMVGNNVYLYGPAGTGKTVLAEKVAKKLKWGDKFSEAVPCYTINCSQWTSPTAILGGFSINGYVDGQLEQAWEFGGVLLLDELPKLDANTAGLLNNALSKSNDVDAPLTNGEGRVILKHPQFAVIATGNTDMKSQSVNFSGNNRQDYSLVDRFVGSMYVMGFDLVKERRLSYTAIYNLAQGLRKTPTLMAADCPEAITLRSMMAFKRTYQLEMLRKMRSPCAFRPLGVSLEYAKKNGLVDSDGNILGKTLRDSVDSFIDSLGVDRARKVKLDAKFDSPVSGASVGYEQYMVDCVSATALFKKEYEDRTHVNPVTGINKETGKLCTING